MAKKTRDFDSSLELLLDTMCNTFGGVMFIAIAIVVLMSMMTSLPVVKSDLKEDCQKLEQELSELTKKNAMMEKELAALENHPAHSQIAQILQIEKTIKILSAQIKLKETIDELKKQNIQKLNLEQTKILKHFTDEEKQRKTLENEISKLQKKFADIQKKSSSNSTYSMTFRIMESRKEIPYFILIGQNKLWQVGPIQDAGKKTYTPCSDCTSTRNGSIVICTPIPEKGIPLLENNSLSPAVLDVISKIPEDRIPRFSISRDSIAAFCKLREYMKQQKIIHGVNTIFDSQKSYSYTEEKHNVNYEY